MTPVRYVISWQEQSIFREGKTQEMLPVQPPFIDNGMCLNLRSNEIPSKPHWTLGMGKIYCSSLMYNFPCLISNFESGISLIATLDMRQIYDVQSNEFAVEKLTIRDYELFWEVAVNVIMLFNIQVPPGDVLDRRLPPSPLYHSWWPQQVDEQLSRVYSGAANVAASINTCRTVMCPCIPMSRRFIM